MKDQDLEKKSSKPTSTLLVPQTTRNPRSKQPAMTTVIATYCDWDMRQRKFVPHCYGENSSYRLPARITKASYIVRYGGERAAMESGNGNVRKILPRFRRRFANGEPITRWRHYIGSHERMTRAVIKFEVAETIGDTRGTAMCADPDCLTCQSVRMAAP